jgi:hypothetical protein
VVRGRIRSIYVSQCYEHHLLDARPQPPFPLCLPHHDTRHHFRICSSVVNLSLVFKVKVKVRILTFQVRERSEGERLGSLTNSRRCAIQGGMPHIRYIHSVP